MTERRSGKWDRRAQEAHSLHQGIAVRPERRKDAEMRERWLTDEFPHRFACTGVCCTYCQGMRAMYRALKSKESE